MSKFADLTFDEAIAASPLLSIFDTWLQNRYKITIKDVKPIYYKGMWVSGAPIRPNPNDKCLTTRGDKSNIEYLDPKRDGYGRFSNPYLTWKEHKAILKSFGRA